MNCELYIVGITGPTGSGKTIAMQALQKHGALALDCDEIYHELLLTNDEMTAEIKARFANVTTDGKIDRSKLGSLVFSDPEALADLGGITHKYVLNEVNRRLCEFGKQGGSIAVVNAIALIEAGFREKCDLTICITAPVEARLSRIMERDGLTRQEATARIKAQKPDGFYMANSDYVIENTLDNTKDFEDAIMKICLIDKWFREHTDEMISDLGKLVEINSVRSKREDGAPFGKNSRKALAAAQEMLEKHDFETSVFEDMVVTASYGPNPPQLGILTHLDIVEAGELWDTDPFELTIKDGKLYGRGVMDNKGPAIASMYAVMCVRELFPDLQSGVQLIFGSGEETGFEDITEYAKNNAMPPNVFSPDSEFPLVNIEKGRFMPVFGAKWEKDGSLPRIISITGGKTPNIVPNCATAVIEGISIDDAQAFCESFSKKTGVSIKAEAMGYDAVNCEKKAGGFDAAGSALTIIAEGVASHASRPHLGNNAQTALVEMLAAMPFARSKGFEHVCALARLFPHGDYHGNAHGLAAQDDISGKTTVSFGVLRYDELEFSASFDARTAVCADDGDILEITRKILRREGMEITYYEQKHSHHTPEQSPFVQTLLRIYEQYTGEKGTCKCLGGLTYVHGIPGGVAFGCTVSEDCNKIHGANEYIDIEHLVMCAKMFTQAIVEIGARGQKERW